jgi:ABC-type amino acid transport substrate-binding protein
LISATLALAFMSAAALAEPATLRLGYQTGDINTQTMYANAVHLFDDAGLKVELIAFPAGPAMLPALAAAQIDLAWMGEFPIVTGYANGMPIEMILIDRINTTNVRLVATAASGINSLADLKGKKIAVSIGSTSHQHIARALKMAGLKQEDVTLVNLPPGNMPAAYAAGQIDAAFTWEPNISIIEGIGGKVIATTKSLGDITGVELAARSAFTKESGTGAEIPGRLGKVDASRRRQPRRCSSVRSEAAWHHGPRVQRHAQAHERRVPGLQDPADAGFSRRSRAGAERPDDDPPQGHRRLPVGRKAHQRVTEGLVRNHQHPAAADLSGGKKELTMSAKFGGNREVEGHADKCFTHRCNS